MSYVLDASAVLAVIQQERGHDAVIPLLARSTMSAVNYAEVISKLVDGAMPVDRAEAVSRALRFAIEPLDAVVAALAGSLRPATRSLGLSLADRCCLALAQARGAVAVTAERRWAEVAEAIGVRVQTIRAAH